LSLAESTFILPATAQLTAKQQQIKEQILSFAAQHLHAQPAAVFVLSGDAGSGKSAVLSAVFNALQEKAQHKDSVFYQTDDHLLVNHNEMLKIYWEIASQTNYLKKKNFEKPTPFINRMNKQQKTADIVFVDEAQLLLSQSDHFNHFWGENQLDEIMKLTHVLILVVDFKQVVKLKSYWSKQMLLAHLQDHQVKTANLNQQLRLKDEKMAGWIDSFIRGVLLDFPRQLNYELQVFTDGQPLFSWVKAHDQKSGLSRMLATTDFPFRVFSKEPWYVTAGTLKLPWDRFNYLDRPWASQPKTINEVGSIYTIQGFDLNYAGVIFGPSLTYDSKIDQVIFRPEKFEDQTAFQKRQPADLPDENAAQIKLLKNVVNILLKRGRLGLGLFAVDPALEKRLLELAKQQGRIG
jgi:DUF2075 family protein